MHDPVLRNCKKYRIPFKPTTKDPNKISQWKIYMWEKYIYSTSYLWDTCNIDFPINNKTRKFKGFAFIRAPAHITDEIIGIAYHDKELRVEDAASTAKRTNNNTLNESRRPFVVVNNYPENQHSYGRKSSASESTFSKRKKQIVIFSEGSLVA